MKTFVKSFANAFRGIYIVLKFERNFRIHIVAMFLAVALGIYLNLTVLEWGLIVFSIGFVLAAELFNTAIERLGDEVAGGKQSQTIRNVKDMSAAAVLLSALTALIIGVLILFIPFFQKVL